MEQKKGKKLEKNNYNTTFLSFMNMNTHLTVSTLTEESIMKIFKQVIQGHFLEVSVKPIEDTDSFIKKIGN